MSHLPEHTKDCQYIALNGQSQAYKKLMFLFLSLSCVKNFPKLDSCIKPQIFRTIKAHIYFVQSGANIIFTKLSWDIEMKISLQIE